MKSILRILVLIIFAFLWIGCSPKHHIHKIQGTAIGTYYSITLSDNISLTQIEIDSLFNVLNRSVSIFDTTSLITKINHNQTDSIDYILKYLLDLSIKVSQETEGAFDCTVGSLVDIWGFGKPKVVYPDTTKIEEALSCVGYQKISYTQDKIKKSKSCINLNFNAIAKGYAVDMIFDYIASKGGKNYLVDIGGEVRAQGYKQAKKLWKIGVQKPTEKKDDPQEAEDIFELKNQAVATSGNYRNYYENNGKRYVHIINPQTGYSEKSNLLSATVITHSCAYADALATAFMVMGLQKTQTFLDSHKDISAILIYDESGIFKIWQNKKGNF